MSNNKASRKTVLVQSNRLRSPVLSKSFKTGAGMKVLQLFSD